MTAQLAMVLGLLVAAVVMFALNRPRMDAVAIIVMVLLPFTGVVSMGEALAGFSDSNVVLIAALFVVGEGLVRTGVAQGLGDWLVAKAGSSETRLLVLLMLVVAGLGSVMSSTGVVAIFIPIVLRIARNSGIPPSRLMMPLSMAALISGMLTLVATAPNLVVNAEMVRHGLSGFAFFSFTPFGLPVLVLGILYMLFARSWLADREAVGTQPADRPSLTRWIDRYGLARRERRVRLLPNSPLAGRRVGELRLRSQAKVNILAIERPGRHFGPEIIHPLPRTELRAGDVLLLDLFAPVDEATLITQYGVEMVRPSGAYFIDRSQEIGMAELMVPPASALVGHTVIESRFRTNHGMTVVGLRRGGQTLESELQAEKLAVGDTLLVVGTWRDIRRLQGESDDLLILNLPAELADVLPASGKGPQAIACLLLVVVLMVTGVVANVHAALIGCLLMGALGCIDLPNAYRSISWQSLVLIVGMLPFSLALERTGGIDLAANGLLALTSGAGVRVVLTALFAVTAGLGLFISNTATAVLMAPVALAIAKDLGLSPYPFAMTVALAASTAFMTPVSSPVNTLVVGPGNYRFGDFVRIGVPFSLVVMVVSVLLVPIILPP